MKSLVMICCVVWISGCTSVEQQCYRAIRAHDNEAVMNLVDRKLIDPNHIFDVEGLNYHLLEFYLSDPQMFKFLISRGSYPLALGAQGNSLLGKAVLRRKMDFVKFCKELGFGIDNPSFGVDTSDGKSLTYVTPLVFAVTDLGKEDLIKWLISEGANVNFVIDNNRTVLDVAIQCETGYEELLRSHGAKTFFEIELKRNGWEDWDGE